MTKIDITVRGEDINQFGSSRAIVLGAYRAKPRMTPHTLASITGYSRDNIRCLMISLQEYGVGEIVFNEKHTRVIGFDIKEQWR